MTTFALALIVAVFGSLAIEMTMAPQPVSRNPTDLAIRLAGYVVLTMFWFQFSWRPWLAASTCLAGIVVGMSIDQLKRRVIGEPLVFSDTALLHQVPRHPELYYALPLSDARMAGTILSITAVVALWYQLEPTVLPDGLLPSLLAIAGIPLALAAIVFAARAAPVRNVLASRLPRPKLGEDVDRYGLVGTMILYTLRRAGEEVVSRPTVVLPPAKVAPEDEVVVVVQLESFLDPTRLGGPPLPLLDRVRDGAVQYGRLFVSAHGAYTMRSEHAVLTGLSRDDLGFGVFDPYLAQGGDEPTSLARLAQAAGFATAFVHPYHRDFFNRSKVMSQLGFERLVMQDDFAGAPRVGPYIADSAFAERILEEVRERRGGRLFVFGASMENHGPWKPGRLAGIDDPLVQYLHHVANTGRAAEMLIDGLAGTRATLCFYGDHPPSLPANRPDEEPPQTDYAVFTFGRGASTPPQKVDLTAPELGRLVRSAFVG